MMPYDFPQFAELWQEQIDPDELRRLQAMARKIERTARRKQLFGLPWAFAAIGLTFIFLWIHPASPAIRLGFALMVAAVIWRVWRGHQITEASRVFAIHDPGAFFQATIKNLQSEISVSTISLCIGVIVTVSVPFLTSAARGLYGVDPIILDILKLSFERKIFAAAVLVLTFTYYVRENIKLRAQLRRLEGMSREWDRHEAGDPGEGPDDTPIPE